MQIIHNWLESIGFTAPWLQAYGSILALGIAIALSYSQGRRERTRELNKLRSYVQAILAISENAIIEARSMQNVMESHTFPLSGTRTKELQSCLEVLTTVKLETLPNQAAFIALYHIRRELESFLVSAQVENEYLSPQGIEPESSRHNEKSLNRAEEHYTKLKQALRTIK